MLLNKIFTISRTTIYNIEGVIRHANDFTSVCAWVEEMKSQPYNPILLFKQQGEQQPKEIDNVGVNDFIIGTQTEFQWDMLIKYGNQCVCMDATHGTNAYDFNLITVLVVDSFGEGLPVAWAIANREDVTILVEFLKTIKERTGPIKTRWFMSDDAYQYFNAWRGVFDTNGTTKLLCAWHVDRAWRTALNQHVMNKQSRVEIYHQLQLLLMENEEPKFRQLLQQFVSSLDSNEPAFSRYFKENYCNRLGEWASHFRVRSVVNTNMFLESFHRTLKVVYLQHKHNRRIDYLLHTLIKISRDKVFERLTKLEKGKFTHRVSEINKRQKEAEKMKPEVQDVNDKIWSITSARHKSIHYTVKKVMDTCSCRLRCSTCGMCVHMYTCSCIDASLHATVCKHVHAISMLSMKSVPHSPEVTGTDEIEYFTTILNDTQQSNQLECMRKQVVGKIHELTVLVNTCPSVDLGAFWDALCLRYG